MSKWSNSLSVGTFKNQFYCKMLQIFKRIGQDAIGSIMFFVSNTKTRLDLSVITPKVQKLKKKILIYNIISFYLTRILVVIL